MSDKNVKKVYMSLEDLRVEFGLNPIRRKTKDEVRLKSQREKFSSRHVCSTCGLPLSYIPNTNVMVCKTPECKGVKHETIDEETGEKKEFYTLSYERLDDVGAKIASNILVD